MQPQQHNHNPHKTRRFHCTALNNTANYELSAARRRSQRSGLFPELFSCLCLSAARSSIRLHCSYSAGGWHSLHEQDGELGIDAESGTALRLHRYCLTSSIGTTRSTLLGSRSLTHLGRTSSAA